MKGPNKGAQQAIYRLRMRTDLEQRCKMIINDTYTFLWAKTSMSDAFLESVKVEKLPLGGGNFLSVLGLMTVLNFLGKIYAIIKDPMIFEKIVDTRKEYQSEYLSSKSVQEFIRKWSSAGLLETKGFRYNSKSESFEHKFYPFNEELCFIRLLKDAPIKALDLEAYRLAYRSYRNSLAHTAIPNDPIFSESPKHKKGDFKYVKGLYDSYTDKPAFYIDPNDKTLACVPEHLQRVTSTILSWIDSQIADKKRIPNDVLVLLGFYLNGESDPLDCLKQYKNLQKISTKRNLSGPK